MDGDVAAVGRLITKNTYSSDVKENRMVSTSPKESRD